MILVNSNYRFGKVYDYWVLGPLPGPHLPLIAWFRVHSLGLVRFKAEGVEIACDAGFCCGIGARKNRKP